MQLQGLVTRGTCRQQRLREATDTHRALGDFERNRPKAQLIERPPSFGLRWADRSPESSHRLLIERVGRTGVLQNNRNDEPLEVRHREAVCPEKLVLAPLRLLFDQRIQRTMKRHYMADALAVYRLDGLPLCNRAHLVGRPPLLVNPLDRQQVVVEGPLFAPLGLKVSLDLLQLLRWPSAQRAIQGQRLRLRLAGLGPRTIGAPHQAQEVLAHALQALEASQLPVLNEVAQDGRRPDGMSDISTHGECTAPRMTSKKAAPSFNLCQCDVNGAGARSQSFGSIPAS